MTDQPDDLTRARELAEEQERRVKWLVDTGLEIPAIAKGVEHHRELAAILLRLVARVEAAERRYTELRSACVSPALECDHSMAVEIARRHRDRATKVVALGSPYDASISRRPQREGGEG